MKKTILSAALCLSTGLMFADPITCMPEGNAEQAAEYIMMHNYVLIDCYSCETPVWQLVEVDLCVLGACTDQWANAGETHSLNLGGNVIAEFPREANACAWTTKASNMNKRIDEEMIINYAYTPEPENMNQFKIISEMFVGESYSSCKLIDIPNPSTTGITNPAYISWYKNNVIE